MKPGRKPKQRMNEHDYPFIRAWGARLRSARWFIEQEVDKARADHAPKDATYRDKDGTWNTRKDVKAKDTIEWLDEWVKGWEEGKKRSTSTSAKR